MAVTLQRSAELVKRFGKDGQSMNVGKLRRIIHAAHSLGNIPQVLARIVEPHHPEEKVRKLINPLF